MDWKLMITDLRDLGMTLEEIGKEVGLPKTSIWALQFGAQKTTNYERGCRLVDLHKRVMRKHTKGPK